MKAFFSIKNITIIALLVAIIACVGTYLDLIPDEIIESIWNAVTFWDSNGDVTPEITVVPTSTPVGQTASQFIAEYYDLLNSASAEDDFKNIYQNFFSEEMKTLYTFFDNYQFWKTVRVKYKIYECSISEVEVELEYYKRSDQAFLHPTNRIDLLHYPLIITNDTWKIMPGKYVAEITCTNLAFEN